MSDNSKIYLRTIIKEDAEVLMKLNNDPEIARCVVGSPTVVSMQQQLEWMKDIMGETTTKRWMICYDGRAVGTVILSSIDRKNGVANINIKLLREFHGKGIAKKAINCALNIAFDELELYCVTAHILSYNTRSQNLFKKFGFTEEGTLRGRIVKNGNRCDLLSYSLLRHEWDNGDECD